MLVERALRRHAAIVVGLAIHVLAEVAVALSIATILARIVGIVRVVRIIWVRVWVIARVSWLTVRLLHVLTLLLRSRTTWVLAAQCWVGRIVAAVLSIIVAGLRLRLRLTLSESRIVGTSTKRAPGALLSYTGFLLARRSLLSITAIVLLVRGRALLRGCGIL